MAACVRQHPHGVAPAFDGLMVAAIEKARQWNILDGTRGGTDKLRAMGGSSATIDQWWREVSDTYQEALYFADKEPARCRKAALDYVLCATNPLPRRFEHKNARSHRGVK